MTNQEKKEYLQKYAEIEKSIERTKEEIDRWEATAQKITPTYSAEPKATGTSDKIQRAVEEVQRLIVELAWKIEEQVNMRTEIEQIISSVENETLRTILYYCYIDGYSLKKIAVELNYCYVHVCRLHGEALSEIML